MCHFEIRKTYRFQIRKINLFQTRKRVVFKYEKCGLYVFPNTNVTYFASNGTPKKTMHSSYRGVAYVCGRHKKNFCLKFCSPFNILTCISPPATIMF